MAQSTWVILLSMLGLLACTITGVTSSEVTDLADANTEFAISLYNEIVELAENGNVFFSPLSISLALGMTYAGARGDTKTQMAQVLEFDEAADSDSALHQAFQKLIETFNRSDKNYTLSIANRLFGRQEFEFLQEYLDLTNNRYNASLKELDFVGDSEGSRTHINEWVEDQTNEKIRNLLPQGSINAATALVLVNAIYFKGLWKLPFDADDTESKPFHSIDGQDVDMDMMYIEKYFPYADISALDSQVIELPYEGDGVSMCIILPNDRQGIEGLEEKLDDIDINQICDQNLMSEKVQVTLPKFKLTQDIALKSVLGSMGMDDLFSPDIADLSGMNGKKDLYVTEVVHKAYVDVNEEGTEAAGATGVIVGVTGIQEPTVFKADHPFIFLIRETTTGSILFIGRLTTAPGETAAVGAFGKEFSTGSANTFSLLWTGAAFACMWSVIFMQG